MMEIKLDGRLNASLDWEKAPAGEKVFWELDLGLFDGLTLPLSDPMQHEALGLALDHFRDTVWNENSVGLCFYRGRADIDASYLNLLASRLVERIPLFLFLDVTMVCDPLKAADLVRRDRFPRFNVVVKSDVLPPPDKDVKVGVCLGVDFRPLLEMKIPFKIIPEVYLSSEWDGLDLIIVPLSRLTPQGERTLRGFLAAGGVVNTLESFLESL